MRRTLYLQRMSQKGLAFPPWDIDWRLPGCRYRTGYGFTPKGFILPVSAVIVANLDQEISFLIGLDRAREALNSIADWPGQSRDLFINLVLQNKGHLSDTKRKSQFPHLEDAEIASFEGIVKRALDLKIPKTEIV